MGAGSGRVRVGDFAEHVFGVVLLNDWSARDMQAREYELLGPFLGKSFATSISPWVVPLDALEPARVTPPVQNPQPLEYLAEAEPVGTGPCARGRVNGHLVARTPFGTIYWTAEQMLAHLTGTAGPPAPATCTARAPSAVPSGTSAGASSS